MYIADSLKLQGENKYLTKRYIDLIQQDNTEEVNPDELLQSIIEKSGLIVV